MYQAVPYIPQYNYIPAFGQSYPLASSTQDYQSNVVSADQTSRANSYARKITPLKGSYEDRKLNPPPLTDAQLQLTLKNYRRKFKALLYYEEEEHVSLLAKK